ncbi:MAG TPA: trypsin-like peptidase domain-containing protein [Flavitalea sp.]|nr:trypsin-like peptidase domain-containing protein [Flavitalea sp.]
MTHKIKLLEFQQIIEQFHPAIIQIATPGGSGTGFYLKEHDVIVTNEHVIGAFAEISITGKTFHKTLARVWYTDRKHDLAFIQPPSGITFPDLPLGAYEQMKDGDEVVAIGHPYGLNYTATQGVISKVDRVRHGLLFIQIDAAINPGNSGGPLVNEKGEIIGVNTFIIRGGDNLGFALPVNYLRRALELYGPYKGTPATRCHSCEFMVLPSNIDSNKYCPACGTEVKIPELPEKESMPVGVARVIESILRDLGKDIKLAREGTNRWEVKEGSARIKINYNADNFFIAGDAYLCQLPVDAAMIKPLYKFLLEENYRTQGLVLSCVNQNIILSCILYDLDITQESGTGILRQLFVKADEYDQLLKKEYGCVDRLEE